ncbi:hypothetical protein CkP1_0212 [Citrobacter phage CkP1]|nr:hypothetical protein CkP1_0212 [Citrobacter phage CkP1]
MKSIFRINGTEIVVEGVAPVSDAFNETVLAELKKIFGDKTLQSEPLGRFGIKENIETYIEGVIAGQVEGEFAVAIQVLEENEVIMTTPAFVVFRK